MVWIELASKLDEQDTKSTGPHKYIDNTALSWYYAVVLSPRPFPNRKGIPMKKLKKWGVTCSKWAITFSAFSAIIANVSQIHETWFVKEKEKD